MAIELITGVVRAALETQRSASGIVAHVMITKDEEGDFKVTFSKDQHQHDNADVNALQYFNLDGLRDFRSLLDAVIEEEEEND